VSKLIRYRPVFKGKDAEMRPDESGDWTSLACYYSLHDKMVRGEAHVAALQAENERLKTERDHYQWASTNDGIACNERARENQDLENQIDALKAEVERLRKAGDAVIEKLAEAYAGEPSDFDHAHVFKGWIEAKGEQPKK
jgi:uncharacterized small protein (DUF1192 family)